MTDAELLEECKVGLGIPLASVNFDRTITAKMKAVKSFMKSAGVSDTMLGDDAAVGAIVMGVTDIWNLNGGSIKFSSAFKWLTTQLAIGSLPEVVVE